MVWRFLRFFLFQFAGAATGYLIHAGLQPLQGAIVGMLVAAALWLIWDLRRGQQLLVWLREGDPTQFPAVGGLWSEVASRTRRLVRSRDKVIVESENRLQEFLAAIQASPNGVVLLDTIGRIEWCNETAADHFGFDPSRDMLQQVGNLVRDPLFAAYQAQGDYTHDVVIPAPRSDSSRPVRLSVHLHRYGEGRRLMMSRDVTMLEQADAMRRDFVANVSHEIRTPLTVLSGFIETLQTLHLDPGDRHRYLGLMAQQAYRMQTLVDDLLTLSRLEGSPPPRMDEWVDVRSLLQQCEQDGRNLSMMMSQMGHVLLFRLDRNCDVAGSRTELLSALCNLVNNAIRYTPTGGTVKVSWSIDPAGDAVFSVVDTGPGVASEHIPRLTERFYRVDRSRSRETGGTGLGLAIVKHVVQRHGGQLHISSSLGEGSTFSITFPASRVRPSRLASLSDSTVVSA
ncbi:MAG: phosphate regulon sensor histidine kinase PhoR [Rhodoferax sp.]|nr:phosphate regulon sensor histidine kinase PhoR [Rhodoferax sp.]